MNAAPEVLMCKRGFPAPDETGAGFGRIQKRRRGPSAWLKRAVLVLGCLPFAAQAADLGAATPAYAPPAPIEAGWSLRVSAYAWMLGLDGNVRTLPPLPAVNVDVSFRDILRELDGAIMGSVEARFGRLLLFSDLILTRVSLDRDIAPLGIPANVAFSTRSFIGIGAVGYRLVDQGGLTFDAFLGVRGFAVDNKLVVNSGLGQVVLAKDEAWLDAVGGARIRYAFNENWSIQAIGFAGAGASKYNWDLFGGVGYAFSRNFSAFAGYRVLKVNYAEGSFVYDVTQQGPLLGLTYTF